MVAFDSFSPVDGIPIYVQILTFIKRGVVAGTITDGEELPSRRVLSALLGINPNTVQKAFKLLEDEQLIDSTPGAKSLVTVTPEKVAEIKREMLKEQVRGITGALKQMGITKEDALAFIESYWDDFKDIEDDKKNEEI